MATPKNRHYAVTPSGSTVTRNSNRLYSHVVVAQKDPERTLANMISYINGPVFAANFNYDTKNKYDGKDPAHLEHAKRIEEGLTLEQFKQENITAYTKLHNTRLENGYYDCWHVIGWTSRLDLAHKIAAKGSDRFFSRNVTIIETKLR